MKHGTCRNIESLRDCAGGISWATVRGSRGSRTSRGSPAVVLPTLGILDPRWAQGGEVASRTAGLQDLAVNGAPFGLVSSLTPVQAQ
jgi:hypothetical protein